MRTRSLQLGLDWLARVGKKIKLKGYLVISPFSNRLVERENFRIGGVASSAASEMAGEEGGFVVPMEGEYDQDQIIEMYQDQVDRWKERLAYEINEDKRQYRSYPKNPEKQAQIVAEIVKMIMESEKELEEAKKENS